MDPRASLNETVRTVKCRRLQWAGHVVRMGETRNLYKILVGKLLGKYLQGRLTRRWEDNMTIQVWKVSYQDGRWIHVQRWLNHQNLLPQSWLVQLALYHCQYLNLLHTHALRN